MTIDLFQLGLDTLITALALSLMLCFIRLYQGPDVPNRTVAFDLISIHAVGIFALFAIRSNSFVLLEGAIITAVLGFLGTVMLARYLERSNSPVVAEIETGDESKDNQIDPPKSENQADEVTVLHPETHGT